MATGIALVDSELRFRRVNPALAESLGLGLRSSIGQSLAACLRNSDLVVQAGRLISEQRSAHWRAVSLIGVDGSERRADLALQPADGGLLIEAHLLVEPTPEASPLSASLRGFAHEVKNPLAGLRGAAQLLQRRVGQEDLKALADMIIDEADRLAALADRLLHRDGMARLGPVAIHRLLQRLAELLEAEANPPSLRYDFDPSLPDLVGDADRLLQLLLNLARNALEAGARTLTLRTRVEHGIRVGERMLRMALRVDVVDDGIGVPAPLRDTLFEPLVSGRPDGSGLGLALSREIAHEHGGDVRHARRDNETIFSLYLPLERGHG